MALIPVDRLHIREGAIYAAEVKGETVTVILKTIGRGWYDVEVMQTKEVARVFKLYYGFTIGYDD